MVVVDFDLLVPLEDARMVGVNRRIHGISGLLDAAKYSCSRRGENTITVSCRRESKSKGQKGQVPVGGGIQNAVAVSDGIDV
jgi:hypothetical protein